MRKGLVVVFAAVLAMAIALPAMADYQATGFLRDKFWVSNFESGGAGRGTIAKDADVNAWVDQRLRLKNSWGEENARVVWWIEVNNQWGNNTRTAASGTYEGGGSSAVSVTVTSSGIPNSGGAINADGVNALTKNLYVWFKVPDTSLDVTSGLVNWKDSYEGLFFNNDSAGIFVNGKMDPVTYRIAWSKFYEGSVTRADDVNLYIGEVKFTPAKDVKLGVNLYYLQDRQGLYPASTTVSGPSVPFSGKALELWMPGVDFTAKAGPAALSGFLFYQSGKAKSNTAGVEDISVAGFAADLRADLNAGPGKAFIEALYVSGGDGSDSDKFESIITTNSYASTQAPFMRMDLSILTFNPDDCSSAGALIGTGTNDFNNQGRGSILLAAGYTQKLTEKITGKVGLGYLQAANKFDGDKSTNMGTEFNVSLNYNVMKGLDVGFVGAYAMIGDFFKKGTNFGIDDASNAYDLHARLNYAF